MAIVERKVVVNAPAAEVFEYIDDPTRVHEYWRNVLEVKDIQLLPNGGKSYRGVYRMVGMNIKFESEAVEHIPGQKLVSKTTGGIDSTITWILNPQIGRAHV